MRRGRMRRRGRVININSHDIADHPTFCYNVKPK